MTWGGYMQPGFSEELDMLGSRLSLEIDCPVHYPAFNKHLFECKCGVIFPYYLLAGGKWEEIKERHREEKGMVKVT